MPKKNHKTSPMIRLPPEKISASQGRIPGLDGLRALSILIVLCGHFFLPDTGGVAALGVYVFFAISGFLITRLLFLELKETGKVSARNFYLRRLLRLYPVLLFYLAVISGFNRLRGDPNDLNEIASVLFYYTNYLESFRILHGEPLVMQIGVLWSLAIEEHFYLIVPLFFIAVKGRLKPLLWLSGTLCVIPLLLRYLYVSVWPELIGQLITYRNSETRFDSIALGVLLAVLCESANRKKIIRFLSSRVMFAAAAALLFFSVTIHDPFFKETLRFSLISLSCIPLISGIVFGDRLSLFQRAANLPPVVWIGKLSYSLYIWHGFTAHLARLMGFSDSSPYFGFIGMALTFLTASASYAFIETPFFRLRARLAQASKIEKVGTIPKNA